MPNIWSDWPQYSQCMTLFNGNHLNKDLQVINYQINMRAIVFNTAKWCIWIINSF
jgi:hypothetical protein